MRVVLKKLDGTSITMDMDALSSMADLIATLRREENTDVHTELFVVFDSRRLRSSNMSLSAIGIKDGQILTLIKQARLWAVTFGSGELAKLWDLTTVECLHKFESLETAEGTTNSWKAAVFSPDGQLILTVSEDTVKLWDAITGQCRQVLKGHTNVFNSVFSQDGSVILTTSWACVKLWSASGGDCLWTLEQQNGNAVTARFSPDGAQILTHRDEQPSQLWSTASHELLLVLKSCDDMEVVTEAEFSPDGGSILFILGFPASVGLWDSSTGECLWTRNAQVSAAFSPDGKFVLIAGETVELLATCSGECARRLAAPADSVRSAMFSPDGARILTRTSKCVEVLDVSTFQGLCVIRTNACFAMFTRDGGCVLTSPADFDGANMWNASTGASMGFLDHHAEWGTGLELTMFA